MRKKDLRESKRSVTIPTYGLKSVSHKLSSILLLDVPSLKSREALEAEASERVASHVSELFLRTCAGERGTVIVVMSEGEPHCAFFDTVTEALHTVTEIFRTSASDGLGVQLRAAIHAGEVPTSDAAKIECKAFVDAKDLLSSALEGQALVSGTAKSLLPDEVRTLIDIGRRRLVDSTKEMNVYSVAVYDSPFVGSAKLASDAPLTNVPRALTRFVGRAREVQDTCSRFYLSRLVTIVGPGGIGKTRLALRVAEELLDRHPDGVWYVNLAEIGDASLVDEAVARPFGVVFSHEVPPAEALSRHLRDRETLILLDNCEHLTAPVAFLIDKLARDCRNVAVLATSRRRLGVDGESVVRLKPMGVPGKTSAPQQIEESDAVSLFLDRAQVGDPDYDPSGAELGAIADLCRRLEGVPLAIELAAAKAHTLPVSKIRLAFSSRKGARLGGTARFGSLQAAIRWSLGIVDREVRAVFNRLAVFEGSFEEQAAVEVCARSESQFELVRSALVQLCDHNLLDREDDGLYRFLVPVREVALAAAKRSRSWRGLLDRHSEVFGRILGSGTVHNTTVDRSEWVSRQMPNLRAALNHSIELQNAERAIQMAYHLTPLWHMKGMWREGMDSIERVRKLVENDPFQQVRLLNFALGLASSFGDSDRAERLFHTAEPIARAHGYREHLGALQTNLATTLRLQGRLTEAHQYFLKGLAEFEGKKSHPIYPSLLMNHLALCADLFPGPETRAAIVACFDTLEPDAHWARANLVYSLGVCCLGERDLTEAYRCFEEALRSFSLVDAPKGTYMSLRALARVAAHDGLLHQAVLYAGASMSVEERARPTLWERSRFGTAEILEEARIKLGTERFEFELQQGFRGGPAALITSFGDSDGIKS